AVVAPLDRAAGASAGAARSREWRPRSGGAATTRPRGPGGSGVRSSCSPTAVLVEHLDWQHGQLAPGQGEGHPPCPGEGVGEAAGFVAALVEQIALESVGETEVGAVGLA